MTIGFYRASLLLSVSILLTGIAVAQTLPAIPSPPLKTDTIHERFVKSMEDALRRGEELPTTDPAYDDWIALIDFGLSPRSGYEGRDIVQMVRKQRFTAHQFTLVLQNAVNPLTSIGENPSKVAFRAHPESLITLRRMLSRFEPELRLLEIDIKTIDSRLTALATEATKSSASKIAPSFPDVATTHSAYPSVEQLRQAGIIIGYSDTREH